MELNLAGRTALVTGGSKGIGFAVAQRLAAEGVGLCLAARSAAGLEEAAAKIRGSAQVAVRVFPLDLADAAARDRLVAVCPDIDILVNNAGAIPGGGIEDVDDDAWRASWELKVFGYINLTRAYFARMKARRRGVIINVIGLGGERFDAGYIAGAAGNASLIAFTKALGGASLDHGVRVLGVNPGPVETERLVYLAKLRAARAGDESRWREHWAKLPMGRPAQPDEIAPAIAFLASDLSSYTSGVMLNIDGGLGNRH